MTTMAERLVQEIEERFPRSTAARQAVVQAIAAQEGHFSAEELCRALPGVGRATVYRALAFLQQEGIICRVVADGALHYRLGTERHHHHLVCVECGEVQDIAGCGVDDFVRTVASRFGYEPASHRLEIYGRCARCQVVPT